MNHFNRNEAISRLESESETFDIAIIGGGASGLGAAVDAAARGYRVALIEQGDFAKGTSSRSTKLVHGGVRYLKQGNISLVLEALKERGLLYANAPHLVHNMAFVIPNYSWWEGPFYGIGMKVYDRMAGKLGLSPSRLLSKEETVALIPTVEQEHLSGGVTYHDGQFDDARLAINLAQPAKTNTRRRRTLSHPPNPRWQPFRRQVSGAKCQAFAFALNHCKNLTRHRVRVPERRKHLKLAGSTARK